MSRRHFSCPYLIPPFRILEIPRGPEKTSIKDRIGLTTFTCTLPRRIRNQKKCHYVHVTHWLGCHFGPREFLWSQKVRKFLLKKLLLCIPLCSSPTLSANMHSPLFQCILSPSYLLHFFSIFCFAFLYKLPLINNSLNVLVFFLLHVFSSSHHSPSFFPSIFVLPVKWLKDKISFFQGK